MRKYIQRLRQLRQQRGISMLVLSELCGLSKNMISMYESGERTPSLTTTIAIADFFDVSLDYLVGRSDQRR